MKLLIPWLIDVFGLNFIQSSKRFESAKVFDRIKKRSGDIRLDELIHTAPMSGRELGSLIVFPSWLHHQVTPVTHGVRKSLVVWNKGWPLK